MVSLTGEVSEYEEEKRVSSQGEGGGLRTPCTLPLDPPLTSDCSSYDECSGFVSGLARAETTLSRDHTANATGITLLSTLESPFSL